jgi:hypothetical protein
LGTLRLIQRRMTHQAGIISILALVIGLGIYAWTRPSLPGFAPLLVPPGITVLVVLWTILVSLYSKYGHSWAVVPVLVAFAVILLWHVGLILKGPGRGVLMAYGVAHLAFWVPFGLFCLMKISKDSL